MIETAGHSKPRRVKLRDVAERAGVDASLVSRVLNDHPKASAGPATRMRILEAARELGYQPNVAARGLRTAKTWTLGPSAAQPDEPDVRHDRALLRAARAGARLWTGVWNACRGRGRGHLRDA